MQPTAPEPKNRKVIAGIIVIVAIALVALGTKMLHSHNTATTSASSSSVVSRSADTASSTSASASSTFKDGTFSATGNYDSPGGTEAIKVSVTLKGGVVTDSTVTPAITTDDEADQYQHDFINGYKTQVVGKKVNSVHLSRVSGSSLTSQGFNDALSQIITQAKS